jgi:hypothetical protein
MIGIASQFALGKKAFDKWGPDPGVSWKDMKGHAATQQEALEDMESYVPEVTQAEREQKNVAAAEQGRRVIEAQQEAAETPGAVADQTAQSIKRSRSILGEGAKAAALSTAATRAETERAADEQEAAERAWKSQETQRMLANLYAYREARKQRIDNIFGMFSGGASALFGGKD